ncbi:uncharacterized protein F4812DRAFT_24789 [Daldinia caldariorum]|uniref:uncharacterized protein n=1 Tax=Daldinia caldariorum TaxID=326644 RepID=UPI002008E64A|nr:uncharacterized protein F4812DRAFT_24789 [Daldinia caldariorum]KAI1472769.1 hypothetical protein F4812DRAFT_24789 [Daldinia caldariorum]
MADNICGPSTAPKSLSRHFEQDRSLQQDRFTSSAGTSSGVQDATQRFRSLNLGDNRFTSDFSGFQNTSFMDTSSEARPWAPIPQLPTYPPFTSSDNFSPAHRVNAPTRPRVSPAAVPLVPSMPFASPPVGHTTTTRAADLVARSRTHWTNEGSQRIPRNDFNQIGPNFVPSVPRTRYADVFRETMMQQHIGTLANQTRRPEDDLDFDAELRAWAAANSPETQAQANAWLGGERTSLDGLVRDTQNIFQLANAHQLTQQNLIALEQEMDTETEPVLNSIAAESKEEPVKSQGKEDTELAMAAQQILNSVSGDKSDKFKNSGFIQMMQKIAAQELVVRDNNLVDATEATKN